VLERTRAAGVLVGKGGLYGNVVRLAPPMTLTDEETAEGLQVIGDAIAAAQEEVSS
jgi:4-aminobutyrate aminotransferase